MQYDCEQACPRLVQVRFVPNLEPTPPNQMIKISTYRQPEWLIRSDGFELPQMSGWIGQSRLFGKWQESGQEKMKNNINPTRKI